MLHLLDVLALNVTHICLTGLKLGNSFCCNAFWKAYRACQQIQGRRLSYKLNNAILDSFFCSQIFSITHKSVSFGTLLYVCLTVNLQSWNILTSSGGRYVAVLLGIIMISSFFSNFLLKFRIYVAWTHIQDEQAVLIRNRFFF